MIRWPWQNWAKPPPPDVEALAESHSALVEAAVRQCQTEGRYADAGQS